MNAGITITKIWADDDLVEFTIKTSDGASIFSTNVYAGHNSLHTLVADLDAFKSQVYGGIYDIRLGEFGPEYASGAFLARLHFYQPGRGTLFITVKSESDWNEFTTTKVASEATLFLRSEPALLDNFIAELRKLQTGGASEAFLQAAPPDVLHK